MQRVKIRENKNICYRIIHWEVEGNDGQTVLRKLTRFIAALLLVLT